MEARDVIALVKAGYTKHDIQNMMGNMQTPQNMMGNMQTPQNMMGNMQTPQNMMGNMQTPQNMMGNMQTPQNVDYKTLYETQKKMMEDMQALNITGAKGAPIDTPFSVVNDFLGGEK